MSRAVKQYDPWVYENCPVISIEDMPEGTYGFIYCVTNNLDGRQYIGKKAVHSYRTLIKKVLNERTGRLNKVKEIIEKESDWKNYFGSNVEIRNAIKQDGSSNFSREIIRYCFSKRELTYYEAAEQFKRGVLESDKYYNDNILGKFYKMY